MSGRQHQATEGPASPAARAPGDAVDATGGARADATGDATASFAIALSRSCPRATAPTTSSASLRRHRVPGS